MYAHAYVHAITDDGAGHLWVGTENGLFEVDGADIRSFGASSGLRSAEDVAASTGPFRRPTPTRRRCAVAALTPTTA